MARRPKHSGTCQICGMHGKLSFEHVPPEAAFNDKKYHYSREAKEIIDDSNSTTIEDYFVTRNNGRKKQGGIGFFTLCTKCNNNTGSWYGKDFVSWAFQCMSILLKSSGKPSLYYPTFIFPLRIIKQI